MMDLKVPRFNAIGKKSNALSANKNSTPISSSSIKSKVLKLKNNGRTIEKSNKVSGNELRSNKSKDSKRLSEKTCENRVPTTTVDNSSQKGFQVENLRTKRNLIPSVAAKTFYRNINVGESTTMRRKPAAKELDKSDKLGQEASSKSMRQLFSVADSWSSDSVVSHSDSCTCCHKKEQCPVHGTNSIADKG